MANYGLVWILKGKVIVQKKLVHVAAVAAMSSIFGCKNSPSSSQAPIPADRESSSAYTQAFRDAEVCIRVAAGLLLKTDAMVQIFQSQRDSIEVIVASPSGLSPLVENTPIIAKRAYHWVRGDTNNFRISEWSVSASTGRAPVDPTNRVPAAYLTKDARTQGDLIYSVCFVPNGLAP